MFRRSNVVFSFALFHTLSSHALCTSSTTSFTPPSTTPAQKELYEKLKSKLIEIEKLNGIKSLLGWDEMVLLPPDAANARNQHKSVLSGIIFEKQTDLELKQMLDDLKSSDLSFLSSDFDRSVVRDAIRDYELTSRKSKELTLRESDLESRGYQAWVQARQQSDFSKFAPVLKEIIDLKTEIASVTHPNMNAYDANIDQFERGLKTERLDQIFSIVKQELWYVLNMIVISDRISFHSSPLIREITESPRFKAYHPPSALTDVEFDVARQKEMCTEIARLIGFDFDKGSFVPEYSS